MELGPAQKTLYLQSASFVAHTSHSSLFVTEQNNMYINHLADYMAGDLSWMEERYSHLKQQSLLWQPPTLERHTPRCTMDGKPTIMLSKQLPQSYNPSKVVEASIAATKNTAQEVVLLERLLVRWIYTLRLKGK